MFTCFENVRQTNEKIEECVKKEENEKSNWMKEMTKIYSINLVRKNIFFYVYYLKNFYQKKLEICTEKCKSEEDLDCLILCGEIFKKEYNIDMEKSMCNQYNKYISTSPSL